MKKELFFFCFMWFPMLLMAHPIKMTTSRLSIDNRSGHLVILINFFIDDFCTHLEKIYQQPTLNLNKPGLNEMGLVENYVTKKVHIKIDHKVSLFRISSLKKIEDNVVQARFELKEGKISGFKSIEISNTLLFDAFREQVNVLHFDPAIKTDNRVIQFLPSEGYKVITVQN